MSNIQPLKSISSFYDQIEAQGKETPQIDINPKAKPLSNELEDIFFQLQNQNNKLKAIRNKNTLFSNKEIKQNNMNKEKPKEKNEDLVDQIFSIGEKMQNNNMQNKDSLIIKPNNPMFSLNPRAVIGKEGDKSKEKIVDDLFCSNVNSKQSVNNTFNNKKSSKFNNDNQKKPPMSLSKHLDELFPADNNKNKNDPEVPLKDRYIQPNMIIEEEQINNWKELAYSYAVQPLENIDEQENNTGSIHQSIIVPKHQSIIVPKHNLNLNANKSPDHNSKNNIIFPSSFDFVSGHNNGSLDKKKEIDNFLNEDTTLTKAKTQQVILEGVNSSPSDNNILSSIKIQKDNQNLNKKQEPAIEYEDLLNFATCKSNSNNSNDSNNKSILSSKIPSFNLDLNKPIYQKENVIKPDENNNLYKPHIYKNIDESTFMLMKSRIAEKKRIEIIRTIQPNLILESDSNIQPRPFYLSIPNKELLRTRNGLINQNYFSSVLLYKEKVPPNIHRISSEYQIKVKENYELIQDQYNLIYIKTTIETRTLLYNKLLCQSEDVNNTYNLYAQTSFETMFNYPHSISTIYFEYFRLFQTNGNSFYCCFMFSYIEQMLIYQKKNDLFALFVDILRLSECNEYAYESINMKEAMAFFALISDLVQINQYTLAYQLFIISFMNQHTRDDVSSLLVLYMKWCLFAMQYDDIYDATFHKTQAGPKLNYHRDEYQINNILKRDTEPGKLVLESVPFIFNVKLKIYWVDGDPKKSKLKINEFLNYNKDTLTIHLGYFYSGYTCVYLKGVYDYNQIFKDVNQNFISNILNITISNGKKCLECNKDSKVVEINSLGKKMCHNCLTKAVDIIIANRAKRYILEGFHNIECKLKIYNK